MNTIRKSTAIKEQDFLESTDSSFNNGLVKTQCVLAHNGDLLTDEQLAAHTSGVRKAKFMRLATILGVGAGTFFYLGNNPASAAAAAVLGLTAGQYAYSLSSCSSDISLSLATSCFRSHHSEISSISMLSKRVNDLSELTRFREKDIHRYPPVDQERLKFTTAWKVI